MVRNYNQLDSKDFQLVIERLPGVTYFSSKVDFPTVSVTSPIYPSSGFADIKVPGDTLVYGPLTVTFKVDEDLTNYLEILDWLQSYTTPISGDQFGTPTPEMMTKVSDATLISLTNKYNPNLEFTFTNMFPIDLSGLHFETDVDDVMNILCTATFDFTYFKVRKLTK